MGLDQYVYKTKREELGYFRKVNFLQGFFEAKRPDEDINCQYIDIDYEMVTDILNRCEAIMKHVTYPKADSEEAPTWRPEAVTAAEEHFPVTQGFFYGTYNYDAWYFLDVKDVQELFQKILDTTDFDNETIEYSCWY